MLQHYVTPIQVNWDHFFCWFAHNNLWQKSIKTLSLLNYGQHPTTHVNMKISGSQAPTAKNLSCQWTLLLMNMWNIYWQPTNSKSLIMILIDVMRCMIRDLRFFLVLPTLNWKPLVRENFFLHGSFHLKLTREWAF